MLHHQSMETLKHKVTCKFCGKFCFTRCKICGLAAHDNPQRGEHIGNDCFIKLHNDHCFGLAVADCKLLKTDKNMWKIPTKHKQEKKSDCLAFKSSQLYHDLENGLLVEGFCIFGDNAYINSPFVATPYPNVSGGYKNAYNLQLRIRVECAFGMFVQRWGVLRSALPCGISIQKTISLVVALAKIPNFCIDQVDT
jgi:hypothetical protein